MAKPYCFKKPNEDGSIKFKAPGNSPFIPLTNLAISVQGQYQTDPVRTRILGEKCIAKFSRLQPNSQLATIVIVPCLLASGVVTYWAKVEKDNSVFDSWIEGLINAANKPQHCSYDDEAYRFNFKNAAPFDVKTPDLTIEEVISKVDAISINDPDSASFAEFLDLYK